MATEDEDRAQAGGAAPTGPFLREYTPVGGFPAVSAQRASVAFYRNGGYSVVTVSGVRHVDKRALARPYTVCEIAQGTFVSPLQLELPAAGGTSFFKAEVDIEWEVTDPHLVAVNVVTDVAQRLTSPVLERLREVTLTYPVTDAEQANRVITRECAGGRWSDLGSELGLRVRLYVRLGVDDEAIGYAKKKREVHADAEVTRVRQEGFRRMLLGGELEQLSFMLAADPEGAKDFLEQIRQEGRQDEKERVDRLYGMALRGELHSVDVETQVLNLLNKDHRGALQGPIGKVPARREPRQLESSADGPFTPDWVSDEPPRRRPYRGDRYPADDTDRQPSRGHAHRVDDLDAEPPRRRTYRPDGRPAEGFDRDEEPAPRRADGPDGYGGDHGEDPARRRPYRPGGRTADDLDLDAEPPRRRTHRPDGHPVDDYDDQPPRDRPYRPQGPAADGFDVDEEPAPRGSYETGRRTADDPDREPPRGRGRSRDGGWSWAEEE